METISPQDKKNLNTPGLHFVGLLLMQSSKRVALRSHTPALTHTAVTSQVQTNQTLSSTQSQSNPLQECAMLTCWHKSYLVCWSVWVIITSWLTELVKHIYTNISTTPLYSLPHWPLTLSSECHHALDSYTGS